MRYIGTKDFDSLEKEIQYYIACCINSMKDVVKLTPEEIRTNVCSEILDFSLFVVSARNEYPTYEELEHVKRIILKNSEIEMDKLFPPEFFQHVMKETTFPNLNTMEAYWTTRHMVSCENKVLTKEEVVALLEKKEISSIYPNSFMYLNLLKCIADLLIGTTRKTCTNQLYRVSYLIQTQTNYIMNNLEILDLCRGKNAEYAISPRGFIKKKSVYEEEVNETIKKEQEAKKLSHKEAKERREREEQEWEELQQLYEEEEEECREKRKQERIWMEEEEKKRRKEEEEHFRQMREMEDIMAYDDMLRYGHYI